MRRITNWLDQRFYPGLSTNWPDRLFRSVILRRLTPTTRLLDLGAGAGIIPEMNFKEVAACACGVDPDPRVAQNPYLHEARIGVGGRIPYPDGAFDVVIANNVLEHLTDPIAVFHEIARVLKPGGLFIAKTPNRNHYMPAVAQMTPVRFHRFYGRLMGREDGDTFPTVYRANSRAQIMALAGACGLQLETFELIEKRPEYLRLSPLTYIIGIAYERMVNLTTTFARWRILIVLELRKPMAA